MAYRKKNLFGSLAATAVAFVALLLFLANGGGADTPAATSAAAGQYELRVAVLDVGQGDSVLVSSGGQHMLVDAGENDRGDDVVADLKAFGVDRLAVAVGTHPHSDHIGGLDVVLDNFPVGRLYMPRMTANTETYEDVLKAADRQNLKITAPAPGDSFPLGEAQVRVLWPEGDYASDNANNQSIVLMVSAGGHSVLLTGDIEKDAERRIVESGADLRCDVIKAPHHGSDTSSTEELLDAAQPRWAIVSVGRNNEYGHPNSSVINRYRGMGVDVRRTDENGTVVVTVANGSITVQNSK